MFKKDERKSFLRWVHVETIMILVGYFLLSNYIFLKSVAHTNVLISYVVPLVFGLVSSVVFLYLFGHEDFFHFIKNIENEEKGKEKKFLDKFKHYGKVVTCILVSALGGPIFLALTVRFLFLESENRYLVAIVSNIVSTIFIVAAAKGLFGIFL